MHNQETSLMALQNPKNLRLVLKATFVLFSFVFLCVIASVTLLSYVSVECVISKRKGIKEITHNYLCHPNWTNSREEFVKNYFNKDLLDKDYVYGNKIISNFGFDKNFEYLVNNKKKIIYHQKEGHLGSYITTWIIELYLDDEEIITNVDVREE